MLTESIRPGEFMLSECDEGSISRDTITVAATAVALKSGTELGIITASGKFAPYNNAHSDGTETAKAILYSPLDISVGDQKAVAITRLAEVNEELLTGIDAPAKIELALSNIIVR